MGPIESLLIEARSKIANPEHWTQGAHARTVTGAICNAGSGDAFCFCASGALYASYCKSLSLLDKLKYSERSAKAYSLLCETADGGNIEWFNDAPNRKHRDVLVAFDRAIALAHERGL